jgi:hypothetical protein
VPDMALPAQRCLAAVVNNKHMKLLKSLIGALRGRVMLRGYEQFCIDAFLESQNLAVKAILSEQLTSARVIQRQAGWAKLCFYYPDSGSIPVLANVSPNVYAATVILGADNVDKSGQMQVKVFVHRGKFFSLEFPKRPSRFADLHGMDLNSLRVVRVNTLAEL